MSNVLYAPPQKKLLRNNLACKKFTSTLKKIHIARINNVIKWNVNIITTELKIN